MIASRETTPIHEIRHGDRIRAFFDPALRDEEHGEVREASGEVMTIVGQVYLASSDHRVRFGMPRMFRIDNARGVSIELLETHGQHQARIRKKRLGELVFLHPPESSDELVDQLNALSEMIASVPDQGFHSRKSELILQFDQVADMVQLAKRKRNYFLTRARIGADFHPWTTKDDRVFRIETERPLPSDLELDRTHRRDRPRRLEESVCIFGEAERETRQYASLLRAAGYDVRRPHPNAQELLVKISWGSRSKADMTLSCSSNGRWSVGLRPPSNKKETMAARRLEREGHLGALRAFLGLD